MARFSLQKLSRQKPLSAAKTDWIFLGITLSLTLFGLLMVYDVSQIEALKSFNDKYYFFRSQVIWIILGYLALSIASRTDYHRLLKLSLPIFLLSFLLILLVFIPGLGVLAGGAHRWLKIGRITIQPVEIIKLTSVILLASLFQQKKQIWPYLCLFALVCLLIGIFQKDLGSAVVYAVTIFGTYFLAGAPLLQIFGLLILGFLGAGTFTFLSSYRRQRLLAFFDPFADPQGYSYHIYQILIALGSGGFWGLGIGESRQKFAYIPEVTTDSIFSVIGEEFGFLGGMILILIFGYLILRGFRIAQKSEDKFGQYLGLGLVLWLGTQIVVNLAAMVSLIPLTGVPLPFISYGGSALLSNLLAVGILLNISRQERQQNKKNVLS